MKKKWNCLALLLPLLPLLTAGVPAAEQPSAEKGLELFNSKDFAGAVSGRSCSSCHPGGAGLQSAWKSTNLAGQVNRCIEGPLKGKPLDSESVEMQSVLLYIRSLKQ